MQHSEKSNIKQFMVVYYIQKSRYTNEKPKTTTFKFWQYIWLWSKKNSLPQSLDNTQITHSYTKFGMSHCQWISITARCVGVTNHLLIWNIYINRRRHKYLLALKRFRWNKLSITHCKTLKVISKKSKHSQSPPYTSSIFFPSHVQTHLFVVKLWLYIYSNVINTSSVLSSQCLFFKNKYFIILIISN